MRGKLLRCFTLAIGTSCITVILTGCNFGARIGTLPPVVPNQKHDDGNDLHKQQTAWNVDLTPMFTQNAGV